MSDEKTEKPDTNTDPLNETNDDGEILTLADLLDQQREIDEVNSLK